MARSPNQLRDPKVDTCHGRRPEAGIDLSASAKSSTNPTEHTHGRSRPETTDCGWSSTRSGRLRTDANGCRRYRTALSSPTTHLPQWLRDLLDTSNLSGDSFPWAAVRSERCTMIGWLFVKASDEQGHELIGVLRIERESRRVIKDADPPMGRPRDYRGYCP